MKGLYLALVTLGLAVLFPDLTDRFVNGTGGTNLVTLRGAEVAVPDWYVWFPDPIADFFDEWIGAPDQWAYYLTLVARPRAPGRWCSSWLAVGSDVR